MLLTFSNVNTMAIIPKDQKAVKKIEIDLTGPEGNVFFLIGTAKRLASQLSLDWEQIKTEMMSSDYENAVATFDKYFGDYVILYR